MIPLDKGRMPPLEGRGFNQEEKREAPLTFVQILLGILGGLGAWAALELWMLL